MHTIDSRHADPSTLVLAGQITAAMSEATEASLLLLFGSCARGEAGPDSDLDLLVVVPRERWELPARFREIGRLRRALGSVGRAVDLILLTPEEFDQRRRWPNHLVAHAVREGLRLNV